MSNGEGNRRSKSVRNQNAEVRNPEIDFCARQVVELGGTPTMEDFCFLIRHAITLEKVEDLPELLGMARERHGYVYGR